MADNRTGRATRLNAHDNQASQPRETTGTTTGLETCTGMSVNVPDNSSYHCSRLPIETSIHTYFGGGYFGELHTDKPFYVEYSDKKAILF